MCPDSLRALSKQERNACSPVYRYPGEQDKERSGFRNAIQNETLGSTPALAVSLETIETGSLFQIGINWSVILGYSPFFLTDRLACVFKSSSFSGLL
jgi:hypothetical protein